MTREHKLALVLGFGLLLFVGILVSDHFSAAQLRDNGTIAASSVQRDRRPSQNILIQPIEGTTPRSVDLAQSGETIGPRLTPQLDGHNSGAAGGFQGSPVTQVAQLQPAPPQADIHVIKSGDSLSKICAAKYGTSTLWKKVAEYNHLSDRDIARLKLGARIELPSAAVLAGEPQELIQPQLVSVPMTDVNGFPEAPGMSAGDLPMAPVTPELSSGTTSYTVRSGDTLSIIAARKLGSKSRWNEIAELNRGILPNPAKLKLGMVIQIPTS